MSSGCATCCKVLLILINIFVFFISLILLVLGVALTAFGNIMESVVWPQLKEILMKEEQEDGEQSVIDFGPLFDENSNVFGMIRTLGIPLIVVSLVIVVVSFLGCCGACCKNKCMLGTYATVMGLLCLAVVGGSVLVYFKYDDAGVELEDKMGDLVHKYYVNETHRDIISMIFTAVQTNEDCCGASGGEDFKDSTKLQRNYTNQKIPISCCITFKDKTTDQLKECTVDHYDSDEYSNYNLGCVTKLVKSAKESINFVLIGFGVFALFLAVLSLLGWVLFIQALRESKQDAQHKNYPNDYY